LSKSLQKSTFGNSDKKFKDKLLTTYTLINKKPAFLRLRQVSSLSPPVYTGSFLNSWLRELVNSLLRRYDKAALMPETRTGLREGQSKTAPFSSISMIVIGGIPYLGEGEKAEWGHAIVAVGYADARKIKNLKCNKETTGALLIRNFWGKEWGDKGYGWLPYNYVLYNVASDF
jgi:hypothetical protein